MNEITISTAFKREKIAESELTSSINNRLKSITKSEIWKGQKDVILLEEIYALV